MLARQALYYLSHSSGPFALVFWRWGLFAQGDLDPDTPMLSFLP
jgi:hypothetical protein